MAIEPPEIEGLPRREPNPAAPWTVRDTWVGLLLLVLVIGTLAVISVLLPREGLAGSLVLALLEPLLVLPVAIILGWKHIHWKHLGFRRFGWNGLAIGCGVLLLAYPLVVIHNMILVWAGVETQGDSLTQLYEMLGTPALFIISAVLVAPVTEEIFFRGFLFPGLRQRYGWIKAMLISSAIFAGFHLQPAALIPTFILGCVLAVIYQQSRSIWPGIIVHFLVNGLALGVTALGVQMGWF
ncbi:MAG: lysostaphin resistance A-like protein [Bacteroidota bacterium]